MAINKTVNTVLNGSDYTEAKLQTKNLWNLEKGDLVERSYFNRDFVWDMLRQRKLISSVLRGVPCPGLFFHTTPGVTAQAANSTNLLERGQLVEVACFSTDDHLYIMDGLQRVSTILAFARNDFRTAIGLEVNGRDIGGQYFKDLPAEYQNRFLNYVWNCSLYTGSDEGAEEMFQLLNGGKSLTAIEFCNAFSTAVACWIREMSASDESNSGKFASFKTTKKGENTYLTLSEIKVSRRNNPTKIMTQCVAYSAMQNGITGVSPGGNGMKMLSSKTWANLHDIPSCTNVSVDLQGEVENVFEWMDSVLMSPKRNLKYNSGNMFSLYMVLRHYRTAGFQLADPIRFSNAFLKAHYDMWLDGSDYNEAYYNVRSEDSTKGLNIRLTSLLTKLDSMGYIGLA